MQPDFLQSVWKWEKNSLKVDDHWSGTSGGKIDCCPLICALAQTGQSQDNHLAHTTTIYPQPCDRTHLYMCNEAQAVCTGTPLKILSDQYDLNGGWFSPNKEPSRSLSIRIYALIWKRFIHHKQERREYLIRGGGLLFFWPGMANIPTAINWPVTSVSTHLFWVYMCA